MVFQDSVRATGNVEYVICVSKCAAVKAWFKKCSGCKATFYCSEKCQLEDWKDHEQNCV